MAFVLASGSPRRRELIGLFNIQDLKIIPSPVEAEASSLPPEEAVQKIALSKARGVIPLCDKGDTILAADTLVFLDGKPLGKPANEDEAAQMLRALSGKTHTVCTGMAIITTDGSEHTAAETTAVTFKSLSEQEISDYIASGEPMDKAGAYGIQGRGSLFITGINGDYFNVVGLPVCRLGMMLTELNCK